VLALKRFELLGRRIIEEPGVGGTDKLTASRPLTVLVPVA